MGVSVRGAERFPRRNDKAPREPVREDVLRGGFVGFPKVHQIRCDRCQVGTV